jgi:hypothetical protein
MSLLKQGSVVSFSVPDAFNHEYEVRTFILKINKSGTFDLIYHNNKCSCKDGWAKFENIPLSENINGVLKEDLILFLERQYKGFVEAMTKIFKESYESVYKGNGFDRSTFNIH